MLANACWNDEVKFISLTSLLVLFSFMFLVSILSHEENFDPNLLNIFFDTNKSVCENSL